MCGAASVEAQPRHLWFPWRHLASFGVVWRGSPSWAHDSTASLVVEHGDFGALDDRAASCTGVISELCQRLKSDSQADLQGVARPQDGHLPAMRQMAAATDGTPALRRRWRSAICAATGGPAGGPPARVIIEWKDARGPRGRDDSRALRGGPPRAGASPHRLHRRLRRPQRSS